MKKTLIIIFCQGVQRRFGSEESSGWIETVVPKVGISHCQRSYKGMYSSVATL